MLNWTATAVKSPVVGEFETNKVVNWTATAVKSPVVCYREFETN